MFQPAGIEAAKHATCGGGGEHAGERRVVETPAAGGGMDDGGDPRRDLVSGDDRAKEITAAGAGVIGRDQGRGYHHGARMDGAGPEPVVELEPMAGGAGKKGRR